MWVSPPFGHLLPSLCRLLVMLLSSFIQESHSPELNFWTRSRGGSRPWCCLLNSDRVLELFVWDVHCSKCIGNNLSAMPVRNNCRSPEIEFGWSKITHCSRSIHIDLHKRNKNSVFFALFSHRYCLEVKQFPSKWGWMPLYVFSLSIM